MVLQRETLHINALTDLCVPLSASATEDSVHTGWEGWLHGTGSTRAGAQEEQDQFLSLRASAVTLGSLQSLFSNLPNLVGVKN